MKHRARSHVDAIGMIGMVGAALFTAAVLTGCGAATDTATTYDIPPPPPALARQLGDAFEGIYTDDSSIVTPLANGVVEVDTGRPCESFRQGVLGSDAVLVGDFDGSGATMFGKPIMSSGFVVSIDTRLVYIETTPQVEVIGCIARLYPGEWVDAPLPGSPSATPGFFAVTPSCLTDGMGSLSLTSYLLTADGYGVGLMYDTTGTGTELPATGGFATGGDGPDGFLGTFAQVMTAAMNDPSLWESDSLPPGLVPDGSTLVEVPVDPMGTVSLTAGADGTSPPAGTVQFGTLEFPLACADLR